MPLSRFKILHLISSGGLFGAENVLLSLSIELKKHNYETYIGLFNNLYNSHLELAKEARKNNLDVAIFPCRWRLDLRTILLIRRFIKEKNIDIVHCHGYKSNFYGLLSSLYLDVKLISTCHNWIGIGHKIRFYENLDKFVLNKFNKIIAVSSKIKKDVLISGIHPSKVSVIDNGVNIQKFNNPNDISYLKKEFNIPEDYRIIGTISRLTNEKGHHYFLEVAEEILHKFPKLKFIIVGDGPLKNSLREESKNLNIEKNAIFLGYRKDIPEILELIDIFVLPSLNEGMPMVLLEAMASKKAIIASNIGAISKLVINKHTGILVKPGDVFSLTKAVEFLLINKEKAKIMSECAFKKVANEFSIQKTRKEYLKVYRDLLSVNVG